MVSATTGQKTPPPPLAERSTLGRLLANHEFITMVEIVSPRGYTATKHQREVGAGYFDRIATTVDPNSSTTALTGSTEEGQFH